MSITDTRSQPAPTPNQHKAAWDLVIQDMRDRDRFGLEKYSTRLQPFNGRDALIDAYQEALDLVVYLRTAIYERDFNLMQLAPIEPVKMPADFGQQNQLTGGPLTRCVGCTDDNCMC